MIRLVSNIRLLICGLCLVMLASAVTIDAHEFNEEVSSEQVEVELEELLLENREVLYSRSKKRRRRNTNPVSIPRLDGKGWRSHQRNIASFHLRTERACLNGIGTYLRV